MKPNIAGTPKGRLKTSSRKHPAGTYLLQRRQVWSENQRGDSESLPYHIRAPWTTLKPQLIFCIRLPDDEDQDDDADAYLSV